MEEFCKGYSFFCEQVGSTYAASLGGDYVDKIVSEIDKLTADINSFSGTGTNVAQLKGDIAEFWHSGTFNIDAAVKGSNHRTSVDRSHDLGSPDITSNFGEIYGLKFCANGTESAKQQAKTVFERYKESDFQGTFEEYLEKNNLPPDTPPHTPLYSEQIRIIPSDQLEEAIRFLEEKIEKEALTRPDQVERYKEALEFLKARISHDGVESIELTKAEAEKVAQFAKDGVFDPAEYGLTTEELVKLGHILNQAWKAGLSAATLSFVIKVAPEIFKCIELLIKSGEVDAKQFKKVGFVALTGAGQGFIRGTISASLTISCRAGLLGESVKNIDPTIIGAMTVITINTMQNAFMVANGTIKPKDLIENLIKDMFLSSASLCMGHIGQVILGHLPIVGFMIGSFVGSIVGSFVYSQGYSAVLSFCVTSGFTMFGLVDQRYTLPEDIVKSIGIDVFEYEKIALESFEYNQFEYDKFTHDIFEPSGIELNFIRRGVIGVRRVGYI